MGDQEKETPDKEPPERDVVDRMADRVFGKETADKIREHNKEIEDFGNKPDPKPSDTPKPD